MNKKLALLTGASRGIGKETARKFAENHYDLVLTCRERKDLLEDLIYQLETEFGNKIFGFIGDLGEYSEVERLQQELKEITNRPFDVIVNNAGISHIGLLTDMKKEEWNQVISSNLTSVFHICRFFVPRMISVQAGRIINVSSVWGNVGASLEVAYSASKGGINAFTKALAKELAPSHICVNAIAFGAVDTEMNQFLSKQEKEALLEEIPACRMATVKEAAEMIYVLATSPEYLTGQVITMDGGWT